MTPNKTMSPQQELLESSPLLPENPLLADGYCGLQHFQVELHSEDGEISTVTVPAPASFVLSSNPRLDGASKVTMWLLILATVAAGYSVVRLQSTASVMISSSRLIASAGGLRHAP